MLVQFASPLKTRLCLGTWFEFVIFMTGLGNWKDDVNMKHTPQKVSYKQLKASHKKLNPSLGMNLARAALC